MLGPLSRKNGIGQMDCRLCLDYLGTTTCVVSSRPACTESAEEPISVQRDTHHDGLCGWVEVCAKFMNGGVGCRQRPGQMRKSGSQKIAFRLRDHLEAA